LAELKQQVAFHEMHNQGNPVPRLVAIQSIRSKSKEDGSDITPLYRHPNDAEPPNEPMSTATLRILAYAECATGVTGYNHALIQLYRDGSDHIQYHSDKTLDVHRATPVLNVSLGASRVMQIRNKANKDIVEQIPMLSGECVVFDLCTNQHWWHQIPKKTQNAATDRNPSESERISITFRRIETFTDRKGRIVGQGSPFMSSADAEANQKYNKMLQQSKMQSKTKTKTEMEMERETEGKMEIETQTQTRSPLLEDNTEQEQKQLNSKIHWLKCTSKAALIQAFSEENKKHADFDWEETYGNGFIEVHDHDATLT
jgi:alkylated DNA repair dioxygenase AlkB